MSHLVVKDNDLLYDSENSKVTVVTKRGRKRPISADSKRRYENESQLSLTGGRDGLTKSFYLRRDMNEFKIEYFEHIKKEAKSMNLKLDRSPAGKYKEQHKTRSRGSRGSMLKSRPTSGYQSIQQGRKKTGPSNNENNIFCDGISKKSNNKKKNSNRSNKNQDPFIIFDKRANQDRLESQRQEDDNLEAFSHDYLTAANSSHNAYQHKHRQARKGRLHSADYTMTTIRWSKTMDMQAPSALKHNHKDKATTDQILLKKNQELDTSNYDRNPYMKGALKRMTMFTGDWEAKSLQYEKNAVPLKTRSIFFVIKKKRKLVRQK